MTDKSDSAEQTIKQPVAAHAVVGGDSSEDGDQGSDTQWIMVWNGDMVLTALLRRQSNAAAGLSGNAVVKLSQLPDQFLTR